jgi:RHS repeat-associated protein
MSRLLPLSHRSILLIATLAPVWVLFVCASYAQGPATGTPPFGSFSGGPDVVNNGNLNDHWTFPIRHKPGRGTDFNYNLSYDSSVWYPVTSGSTTSWQPVSQFGWSGLTATGYATFKTASKTCRFFQETRWVTEGYTWYYDWVYVDSPRTARPMPEGAQARSGKRSWGIAHPMIGAIQDGGAPDCGPSESTTLTTNDGSGLKLAVDNTLTETLYTAEGLVGSLQGNPITTDRNGNEISLSNGVYTDTLGATTLTVTGNGTASSPYVFTYTAPSGTSAHYTLNYTNFTVATNFVVSGISEYKSSAAVPLPTSLTLPDGSQYTFSYEATPGSCTPYSGTTCVTARIASVTAPTGGTISYVYYNRNNNFPACTNVNYGIFSDGSASCLQRTLNDGNSSNTWIYTRTLVSGRQWTTTITSPPDPTNSPAVGNDTVLSFQEDSAVSTSNNVFNDFYETQRVSYQGAASSNNVLQTVNTCYNSATSPCTTTTVSSPITQLDVLPSIPSAGSVTLQSKHTTKYNSVGGPIETDAYAFGSGTFGGLLTQTLITYASLPPNITAFKQTVTVKNSAGAIVSQTNYNYDQTTPVAAPTGTPQLASVSGSRGNLTSVQRCTNLTNCASYLQTTMTYDTAGQLQTVQDPLNNQTSFGYADSFLDDDGSNPPSHTHTTSTPTDAFVTTVTPPLNGAITSKYYYYNGATAVATDQNGNSSWSHFDSIGRPSSAYGPTLPIAGTQNTANPWTLINYTSTTQVHTYMDINDSSTTATSSCSVCRHDEAVVDGLGRAINAYLKSDPEGQTEVDTAFDALGRPKSRSHPYRSTNDTTYGIETPTYDALGRPTKFTHPDTTYSLAAFGANVTGSNVNTAQLCPSSTYGLGYPSLFTDESGRQREIWTDALGRTIEADEPDSSGSLKNSYVCYQYDPLGNLLSVVHSSTPSQTRSYLYDALSRVTSVTIPELANSSGTNCAVTYSYDSNSNVYQRIAPAPNQNGSCTSTVTTTYSYDTLNRLTKIAYNDGTTPTVQYAYDGNPLTTGCVATPPTLSDSNPKGRMTSMCDGSGATSWAHDALGRIVTEKRAIISSPNNVTQTLSYSYNLDSSIYSVTYPSGKVVNYTVSNAQRLLTAKDSSGSPQYALLASYAPTGGLQGMVTGQISGGFAGINECHSYNSSLEYTSTKATSNACSSQATGTTMDLGLQYNLNPPNGDNGTVTTITNNISTETGRTETLTYDPLNRITQGKSQATSGTDCWGQNFAPDALANLNSISNAQCANGTLTVSVDANNHINSGGYSYDASGNMIQDGTSGVTYTFDAENRLYKVTGVTNGPWCYFYDGNGLRVAKMSNANSTCSSGTYSKLYWRSLSGDTLAETDNAGNTQNEYVFFAGRRVASRDGSGHVFYYFADQLGSTRTITTGSGPGQTPGQLCYDQDYTPYGQEVFTTANMTRLQTTACQPSYKFTGYERDPETGLDYAFARYYSSRLGRFLSTDPLGGSVGNLQSNNAYAYVVNSPMNLTDPLGMHCLGGQTPGWNRACPDPDNPYPSGGGGGGGCSLDGCGNGLGGPACYLNGAPVGCNILGPLLSSPSGVTTLSTPGFATLPNGMVIAAQGYCVTAGIVGQTGSTSCTITDTYVSQGSDSSWWGTFFQNVGHNLVYGLRRPNQSFGSCMNENIRVTTGGLVDTSVLYNKAAITAEAVGITLASVRSRAGTYDGIQMAALTIMSAAHRLLDLGLGASRAVTTSTEVAGYGLAVAGGATIGLTLGSAFNCVQPGP